MTTTVPSVELNNGVTIPQLGFGVFQVPDEETTDAVRHALEAGYRALDTAAIYGNEQGVGRALADSDLAREDVFVTTKLWNADQGYDATLRAFDASLERLGLDHVDLYLIHWPTPAHDLYPESWRALAQLAADGRIRAAGVSNFQPAHLQRLLDTSDLVPAVNQIELHPGLQQSELRAFHARHGIATQAWSPLGRSRVLADPTIRRIAAEHGVTPAQAVIRWHLQTGGALVPKSTHPHRLRENLDVDGFSLSDADLAAIAALETGERTGTHPDDRN